MAEPVEWRPDGTPRSARFDDIYRPSAGGLEQARHVFLHGCGLPEAWADRAQWRIFETGFGLGLNFLATWRMWKDDPGRPRMLHFVSVEAFPVAAEDIVHSASGYDELLPLARELAAQWRGLATGAHRFSFEQGRVLLTLHVRDAREMRAEPFTADSVFLDGFDPRSNPDMWSAETLKAVTRHCRRGTQLATWTVAGEVRRTLEVCGFEVRKVEGLPPKRECTQAVFDPRWQPKGLRSDAQRTPGDAIVVGAGLAGAAATASLARRGWRVTVLDAAETPAAGASALPVGLLAPHVSPDDNLLSRLTRAGVRITLQQARELLREAEDWQATGVMRNDGVWQEHAAWVKPAALVRAWLGQPGIEVRGGTRVSSTAELRADLVVVAAAHASQSLLGDRVALHPVRGQIIWGPRDASLRLPDAPVNGDGHFVPTPDAWFSGSTYGRGDADASIREEDTRANLERLASLLPDVAAQLSSREVHAWAGVRCTSADRRPVVGEIEPGLCVTTAMGSRGLTFSALAGELIAAQLHDEPWPLDARLAQALSPGR
jgi:tRNA 5-methylaminomethyl-2-thiouridine biosynthesis bifunctional protein